MIKDYLNKTLDEVSNGRTQMRNNKRRSSEESKQTLENNNDYSQITLVSKEYDQRYKLSPKQERDNSTIEPHHSKLASLKIKPDINAVRALSSNIFNKTTNASNSQNESVLA